MTVPRAISAKYVQERPQSFSSVKTTTDICSNVCSVSVGGMPLQRSVQMSCFMESQILLQEFEAVSNSLIKVYGINPFASMWKATPVNYQPLQTNREWKGIE